MYGLGISYPDYPDKCHFKKKSIVQKLYIYVCHNCLNTFENTLGMSGHICKFLSLSYLDSSQCRTYQDVCAMVNFRIIRSLQWFFRIVIGVLLVLLIVFIALDVSKRPQQLISLLGYAVFIFFLWIFGSKYPTKENYNIAPGAGCRRHSLPIPTFSAIKENDY